MGEVIIKKTCCDLCNEDQRTDYAEGDGVLSVSLKDALNCYGWAIVNGKVVCSNCRDYYPTGGEK